MAEPVFEALVPQVGDLQAWSFPAHSLGDAVQKAASWCLRSGWLYAESTRWSESVEFALRAAGDSEWTWHRAQARVAIRVKPIGVTR